MTFNIWILVLVLNGDPQIIDWFDTKEQCEAAIVGGMECKDGTVLRPLN